MTAVDEAVEVANSTPVSPIGGAAFEISGVQFRAASMLREDGAVPLLWWTRAANFGDVLSPYLVRQMTGLPVRFASRREVNYSAVGSIVRNVHRSTVVWGSGLMGHENKWLIPKAREYRAVRGPITRSILRNLGYEVPAVYGDPALLMPYLYRPRRRDAAKVGLVVRWSETRWRQLELGEGVKLIDLASADVERILDEIASCEHVVSSSLHGLVIADAYGIPNAWLESDSKAGGSRPGGGEFKFVDYFASVGQLRKPQQLLASGTMDADCILNQLQFTSGAIDFDPLPLLDASPFVERV